jgi:predicted RNase H-like nuclease (RuvC/YqgF family)
MTALHDTKTLDEYIEAGGKPFSSGNQRILGQLVEREVVHCCSTMVYELMKFGTNLLDWNEDMANLCSKTIDLSEEIEELEEQIADLEAEIEDQVEITDDLEDEHGQEQEALEHWIVTRWFADRLAYKGEITGELFDFHIWGRQTSGQAIALDTVIASIAAEMQILQGQQYEWSTT